MSVKLVDWMGDDLAVVEAARTSYDKAPEWGHYQPSKNPAVARALEALVVSVYESEDSVFPVPAALERVLRNLEAEVHDLRQVDAGLISSLAKNRHGTPFEMIEFKFKVITSIDVAREWFRHRIGSFNERSTRYTPAKAGQFVLPEPRHMRRQTGKPMAYRFESAEENFDEYVAAVMELDKTIFDFYSYWTTERGLAKELVRKQLPLSLETAFIWKVNFRALTNFLVLRGSDPWTPRGLDNAGAALLEIREAADEIEDLIKPIIPVTYAAWIKNCVREYHDKGAVKMERLSL